MSMSYSMILVPDDPRFSPGPERICNFLAGLFEMGALGQKNEVLLRDHQTRGRIVALRNPRTGETIEQRYPEIVAVESVRELPKAIGSLTSFDAVIEGIESGRLLPIRGIGIYDNGSWTPLKEPITSKVYLDEFEFRVECCQRPGLTSTSDLHEETSTDQLAEPFGEPCELGDRVGRYSNPETNELITVPNAGCATFWIAFQLGRWMFPSFTQNRIDFAEPNVLRLAETAFGTTFAEGCSWG